jgi:hypothetical protein
MSGAAETDSTGFFATPVADSPAAARLRFFMQALFRRR